MCQSVAVQSRTGRAECIFQPLAHIPKSIHLINVERPGMRCPASKSIASLVEERYLGSAKPERVQLLPRRNSHQPHH